jgi:hypothetical protein
MRRRTHIIVVVCCAAALAGGAVVVEHSHAEHQAGPIVLELPRASCGSARTHLLGGDTTVSNDEPNALSCFGEAARDCTSASIVVDEAGVDTGDMHFFRIEPDGAACQAVERSQAWSANWGFSSLVRSQTCDGIAVTSRGVTLSCGGQDLLIPAVTSHGLS